MKKENETRSAVITGAGSGLGFATAKMQKLNKDQMAGKLSHSVHRKGGVYIF